MPDDPRLIGQQIRRIDPSRGSWIQLEVLLERLWECDNPEIALGDLFTVFERYPDGEDGGGVFWSILHGIEALPNYEEELVSSVRRQPSEFTTIMISRIMNSGQKQIVGVPVIDLLAEVAASPGSADRVSALAKEFMTCAESSDDGE